LDRYVREAVEALDAGELIAYVTETVFGLACDAANEDACARLCALKRRPPERTLPVQAAGWERPYWRAALPPAAEALLQAFSPGPITVVVPGDPSLAPHVIGPGGTTALRIPNHPVPLALLRATARPLACPSANPTGMPAPVDCETVERYFPKGVAVILTGGPKPSGVPSTVVDAISDPSRVLRVGAISEQEVMRCLV
jgi:L-threonylcarbamoyladenylate synthase